MTQPYLASAKFDLGFIIAPAFVVTLVAIIAAPWAQSLSAFPVWLWVMLIIGVDVSHVWSTLFRTYFDCDELRQRPALYQLVPLGLLIIGTGLYSLDAMIFWRALTYLAVFHFVRQQYGFMMIYARADAGPKWLDKAAIYGATLVPLIYWHSHQREFNWFIEGDFFHLSLPYVAEIAMAAYGGILILYAVREWRTSHFNIPKNLLLLGTILSWGVGIIAFDNDIIFTATNVLAHGIPYLALTWLYGHNQRAVQGAQTSLILPFFARLFTRRMIPVYVLGLCAVAFVEEGLWDGLIWGDHRSLFQGFNTLPLVQNAEVLMWLVPLLALPQATHYVLDAFIWRTDGNVVDFRRILFLGNPSVTSSRHD
jgi:hypothetical protein